MESTVCIAMDFYLRPVKVSVEGSDNSSVAISGKRPGFDRCPIWVPRERVIAFNAGTYETLIAAYQAGDKARLERIWKESQPWG